MTADPRLYDRRELLTVAAAAAAVAYLPFGSFAAPAVGATERRELLADWSIDDQWGVCPRWDSIPCTPQYADDPRFASLHPADAQFVA
jgi:hypothetical protein